MKNIYFFLTGLFLLTAGTQFLSDSKETLPDANLEVVTKTAQNSQPSRVPHSLVKRKVTPAARSFAAVVAASVSNTITNDVGLPGGSAGDEIEYTATIQNTGTDPATNVTYTDQVDINTTLVPGSVKVSPVAVGETYSTIGNVGLDITADIGVLANDVSPDNSTMTITGPSTITTAQQGTVNLNLTTGAFTYVPKTGHTGTDSFTYTLENGSGLTPTATVNINLSSAIWFINASASPSGADGTLGKPFTSVSDFNAINDGASLHPQDGHSIFIYSGNYTGPLTLRSGQKLIGQGAGESIITATGLGTPQGTNMLPATGGARPVLTSASNAINTNANNRIQGLDVGATTGTKIIGSSFGTLTIKTVGLSGTGPAINLSTGVLAADFSEVSSNSGSTGINISNATGSLKIDGGSITSTAATAIQIAGQAANNRLSLNTTLLSVSSSAASKGVSVSNTNGTFQITGSGTTAGSGGNITNISARGFELINAQGITLNNVNLTNANLVDGTVPAGGDNTNSNAAIYANNVAGLTLTGVAISGTTVQQGINMLTVSDFNFNNISVASAGNLGAQEEGCIYAVNSSGNCYITNSTFGFPSGRVAYFRNSTADLSLLTVNNSTFKDAVNGPGILFEGYNSAIMNLKVFNSSDFLRCQTRGIAVYANQLAQLNADIRNNIIDNGTTVGTGIDIAASTNGIVKFNIIGNNAKGRNGAPIIFAAFDNSYLEGTVSGNTLTKNGGGGSGILYNSEGPTARAVVKIENNTISNTSATDVTNAGSGIALNVKSAGAGVGPVNHFTIIANNINVTGPQTFYNIDLNAVGGYAGNNAKICANLTSNTIPVPYGDIAVLRARPGNPATQILFEGGSTVYDVWNTRGNTPFGNTTTIDIDEVVGTFAFNQTCAVPNVPGLRMGVQEVATNTTTTETNENEQVVERPEPSIRQREKISKNASVKTRANRTSAPQAGETVTVNGSGSGFTLPAGQNVTIKYKVTVNNDVPASVCEISNDAAISGTEFTTFTTTPTVTALTSAPEITLCPGDVTVDPDAGACVSTQTLTATAIGCPAPALTYEVAGSPITFPFDFPQGTTTVTVTAANGIGSNATCSYTVTVNPIPDPLITLNEDGYACSGDLNTYTAYFTAAAGTVITTDKGTVSGSTVTGIPSKETAIITATLGTCSDAISVYRDCSLPVTLIEFNARKEEDAVAISWKTAVETNSDRFEIERSFNAKSWQQIGIVTSTGESKETVSYFYKDTKPSDGENYYRLKSVDLDGTFAYSHIAYVRYEKTGASYLYPNPVSDILYFDVADWNNVSFIELHNVKGRSVYKSGAVPSQSVSVKNLDPGMYIVSVTNKYGVTRQHKLIISR